MIDILTLNYNDFVTTKTFVTSVKNYSCIRKILIVDNHSTDDSLKKLKLLESDKIIVVDSGRNGGYGAGNNFGIKYLKKNFNSDYILLSNPDVIVAEDVLIKMEDFLRHNENYACVAPFMCDAKGKRQYITAFRLPTRWEYVLSLSIFFAKFIHSFCYMENDYKKSVIMDVGSVAGSLFLLRTDDFLDCGLFDENIFLYCEEVVIGKKLKKYRKKIALLTDEIYIHNHSVSINKTYKSFAAKKALLNKSKLYVLKTYFHINLIQKIVAEILTRTNFFEYIFINVYRMFKVRGGEWK